MAAEERRPTLEELDQAAAKPVLQLDSLASPVKIASMELLRNGRVFLVRVRSTDGAEGLAVPNADRLMDTYPIFLNHIAPYLMGQDAREWEAHLFGLYRHDSNYKLQGLALWVCVAAAEFAVLDLLGKLAGKSIGELLGGVKRRDIAVYRASGNRGQHAPGGDRVPAEADRGDRGQGPEVPPRRPDEQQRRLARPDAPRRSSRWFARRSATV